jgi:hypothetical protein
MKAKLLMSALILVMAAPVAESQVLIGLLFGDKLNNDRMEFGFNVGLQLGNISGIEGGRFAGNLGLGLFMDYKISDRWIFSPSLLFSSKKGVQDFGPDDQFYPLPDTLGGSYESKRVLRYFDLPLMVSYRFRNRLGIGVGLEVGYLNKARDYYSGDNEHGTIYVTHDIKDSMSRFGFGVVTGLSFHFKGNPGAQIRVNYIHGLTNVYRKETNRKGYNRTVQLGVMIPVKFGVGKKKDDQDQ